MDRIRDNGRGVRSLACAILVRTAKDLLGGSELQRYDALRFCGSAQCDGLFRLWSDASGLGWEPAEMRRRLFKLLSPTGGKEKGSMDDERKAAEGRVEELQGLAQTIEGELAQARERLRELEAGRKAAMLEALRRGKRADVGKATRAMAREREKVGALKAESQVAANTLARAEEALAPFLIRERLLEAVQKWEKCCYQVKGLYDKREDNWDALRDYRKACWQRDEIGLQVLVDAGVGPEGALRRHKRESDYLAGLDHYPVFSGLYPECVIILRRLQRELQGSTIEPPMIDAVSGVVIAQALNTAHDNSVGRLRRFKAFQDFYVQELPDDAPYDELSGKVHYLAGGSGYRDAIG